MNREDMAHIIRAAADVTNEYAFIIVGSQSILGPIPYPPDVFRMSAGADKKNMRARIRRWVKLLRAQGHAVAQA